MKSLIAFFVKQKIFSDLTTLFVILIGISCAFLMRREAFPVIKFDIITVATIFPGASPDEVERLITNPLEIELREVDGIKKVSSVSRQSTSMIVLQLDPDQASEFEVKADVQDVVDRFKDLPKDAERPVVTSVESGIYPIIQVSLTSSLPGLQLRELAREIEKDLETLQDVAKVTPTGMQDLEIHVEADLKKMSSYRISFEEIIAAIRNQNLSIPGGSVSSSNGEEIFIRTVGDLETIEGIEHTVVRANDLAQPIMVKNLATVNFKLKDNSQLFKTNGLPAINLTVLRKSGADTIDLVDRIKARVKELEVQYKDRLTMRLLDDESVWIKMRLNTVTSNFIMGLILVFIILSLLLPPIIAFIVAIGVPFSFLGTMIVFYNMDYSLNLLTMLGLVIVVGMLVDDAIVTTENSMRLFEEGMSAEEAAIEGTHQVVGSVFGSVMTTVLAFLPLALMTGIFGKFIKFVPVGVIVALLISLVQAYFILPNHFARWVRLRDPKQASNWFYRLHENINLWWNTRLLPKYRQIIEKFVHFRYRVLGAVFFLLICGAFTATRLSFVLFPPDGIEIFLITADTKIGTDISESEKIFRPIEQAILDLPKSEIQDFTTQLGLQVKDPGDPGSKYGEHLGMFIVYLTPVNERDRSAEEIIEELRQNTKNISNVKLNFEKMAGGPPVGKAISIGVQGQDYPEILKLAERIKEDVGQIPGTSDLELSYQLGNKEVLVQVNPVEASAAGLNVASIGYSVRAAYEGIVESSIKKLDEEIDIRVSLADGSGSRIETLPKLLVPNQQGQLVPLGGVAKFKDSQGIAAYMHQNNRREVRVLGEIDNKVTDAGRVVESIRKNLDIYKKDFPSLNVSFGGENEDTEESMQSLMRTFLVAFAGIFIILVLTFQNVTQPILVAGTIPIGAMSVIFTFALHSKPLSFMGMLGIISLGGVIVNNAIVMVDFVNQLRKEGVAFSQSIVDAAVIRLRPIFLTTATTVVGILPTAYGIGGNDDFVKPIALALGWGLLMGSVVTVLAFPAMIAILDDLVLFVKRRK